MVKYNAQAKHLVEAKGPIVEGTPPQDLLRSGRQKYLIVNVVSRRSRELNRGERARVDIAEPHSNTEIVLAEIQADKLKLIRRAPKTVLVSMIKNE